MANPINETRQQVHRLIEQGWSLSEVGQQVGLSRQRIHQIVKEDNLRPVLSREERFEQLNINPPQEVLNLAEQGGWKILGKSRKRAEWLAECVECHIQISRRKDRLAIRCIHHNWNPDQERWKLGTRFGHWTVIKPSDSTTGSSKCQCDCGRIKEVDTMNLLRGKSQGCLSCRVKDRHRAKKEERHE